MIDITMTKEQSGLNTKPLYNWTVLNSFILNNKKQVKQEAVCKKVKCR